MSDNRIKAELTGSDGKKYEFQLPDMNKYENLRGYIINLLENTCGGIDKDGILTIDWEWFKKDVLPEV